VTRRLTLLFAIAGGLAVGNLYYAQPLLEVMARDLHVSHGAAGLLVTATQTGYALGIFLFVPLGDLLNRRRLVSLMMLLSAVALVGCAVAPSLLPLAIALGVVGLTTVAGQILTPLAGDLASEESRGRVVGVVVSGLITGILVSRTLSGLVAGWIGWRGVFVAAAGLSVLFSALLYRAIPDLPQKTTASYGQLLRSVFSLVARERTLQISMAFGATGFAMFTMFWTALTFLLSGAPYHFSPAVIGLFGIIGLVGSIAAQGAGRLYDRGWSVAGMGVAWSLLVVAWVLAGLGPHVLLLVILAVMVLDAGVQGQNILNQSRIFAVSAQARSRLNTAFITGNFVGGALGSVAASVLWSWAGWRGISVAGAALACFGLLLWIATRRGSLRPRPASEPAVVETAKGASGPPQ
jgi:predicted MFS family arabinose efflux permease